MNILFLANHFNVGGITSYILTLSSGLKKRGHNVFVASGPGGMVQKLQREGINFIPVNTDTKAEIGPKVLMSFLKLLPEIKKHNIDIIHANTRVTQVLSCALSAHTKKIFVSTCHGFFKQRFLRKMFPCWGKKVIAISQQVKDHLISDFHVREKDISLIHNGIDIQRFMVLTDTEIRRSGKRELGLHGGPVVGIIARLSEVKGHVYLIEAVKKALEVIPDIQLLIVGEGKIKEDLMSLTRELKIEKSVVFLSNIEDTRVALAAMDIFAMPSLNEGLGLGLMEAMASGVSVIGSDVGGIKTLIRDGVNGLLVRPRDSTGLAKAIIELLDDFQKRERFTCNAREFISQNFSQEEMVRETEEVYSECLK